MHFATHPQKLPLSSHWLFFLGYVPYLKLRFVLRLSITACSPFPSFLWFPTVVSTKLFSLPLSFQRRLTARDMYAKWTDLDWSERQRCITLWNIITAPLLPSYPRDVASPVPGDGYPPRRVHPDSDRLWPEICCPSNSHARWWHAHARVQPPGGWRSSGQKTKRISLPASRGFTATHAVFTYW